MQVAFKTYITRFNWISFLSMIALIAIGAAVLASAGEARGGAFAGMWRTMVGTAAVGLVLYFVLAFTDYRSLLDWCAYPAYAGAICALVLVLAVGTLQFGGRRWLWFFQPSEISKLCLIACFAQLFGPAGERFRGQYGFRGFLLAGVLAAVPCALILLEPDLGTTLTLVPAIGVMMIAAGVWRKGIFCMLAVGIVAATAILGAVYEAERPGATPEQREQALRYVPLHDHQVERVKTFLFPEDDGLDSGYNLRQAKMTMPAAPADGHNERLHLLRVGGGDGVCEGVARAPCAVRGALHLHGVDRLRRGRGAREARRAGGGDAHLRPRIRQHRHVPRARPDHGAAASVSFAGPHVPGNGDVRTRDRTKHINTQRGDYIK